MDIEFDEEKRQLTLLKRGLDFARAGEIFDGTEFTWIDDRAEYEKRDITPSDSWKSA